MFRRIKTQYVEFTEVVDIKVLDGYKVWVRFHDGTDGIVDMSEYCDKPFSAEIWADREKFESVYLEHGVPKWSEDCDIAPEHFYHKIHGWCPECSREEQLALRVDPVQEPANSKFAAKVAANAVEAVQHLLHKLRLCLRLPFSKTS